MSHGDVIRWRDPSEPAPVLQTGAVILAEFAGGNRGCLIPFWFYKGWCSSDDQGRIILPGDPLCNLGLGLTRWALIGPAGNEDDMDEATTIREVTAELARARAKFPGNRFLLAALTEEVGELAQALLQRQGDERVTAEAIQVATVAIRIAEEGDASFSDITAEESQP